MAPLNTSDFTARSIEGKLLSNEKADVGLKFASCYRPCVRVISFYNAPAIHMGEKILYMPISPFFIVDLPTGKSREMADAAGSNYIIVLISI